MRARPGGFPQKHALIKTAGGFPAAVLFFILRVLGLPPYGTEPRLEN
jgi:hypothetical protein